MNGIEKVSRRDFLRYTGLGGGALVLGVNIPVGGIGGQLFANGDAPPFGHFISIATDGTVSIISHRSEMGQGIRSTLPWVVADELEAEASRVKILQADGDKPKYGDQWTDGSRSVTLFYTKMRQAGASARHMLVAAAAQKLGVSAAECEARNHKVTHKASGRSVGYGEVAAAAGFLEPPAEVELKPSSEFRYIGKDDMPFYDVHDMTTGKAVYGADIELPGMLTAMIERCPVVGGKLKSFDATKAQAVPGVKRVYRMKGDGGIGGRFKPLGGVVVVAENTWAAWQGRRALKVEWDRGPHGVYESYAYRRELERSTDEPGEVRRNKGDVEAAFGQAHHTLEAKYYVPHFAQAPLEPPVAVALLENGHLEVWAPAQTPWDAKQTIMQTLGIPRAASPGGSYTPAVEPIDDVTVHVTLLGGGFGRKSLTDFVAEAAVVAADWPGVPIRVQWTREDDLRHSFYHAVSHQYLKAGVDANGRPTAWLQRSAFPTLQTTIGTGEERLAGGIELGMGLLDVPYDVENIRIENCEAEAHTRIGWLRSVANIYHAFAAGSFVDELAVDAGRDPKDYLLEMIGPDRKLDLAAEGAEYMNYGFSLDDYPIDTARMKHVVRRAAAMAGWGKAMPAGRGLGIAVHRSFLSYVAIVVDASLSADNELKVHEVFGVIDCGLAVNPERVRAQMEGGIIYGLSLAIHDDITFRQGEAEQSNFHDYPTLRLDQTPGKIEVEIVDIDAPPGGVGEPPTPPVAPALTNAIVAAGGPRVRDLPLWRTFDFG